MFISKDDDLHDVENVNDVAKVIDGYDFVLELLFLDF
jgi:hypothetical protein